MTLVTLDGWDQRWHWAAALLSAQMLRDDPLMDELRELLLRVAF